VQRQIVIAAIAALLVCVSIGLFNAAVDPYGIVNWIVRSGFNSAKPAQQQRIKLVKAADIRRVRPRAIVLGTSRSHIGLRMSHPGWKASPRYNAAFDGATLEESYAYLQHAEAIAPLQQVVLGIDTWQLEENPTNVRPDFDSTLLARPQEPWTKLRMRVSDLRLLLSVDTLTESLVTIHAQNSVEPNWFAADGQRLGPKFFRRPGEDYEAKGPRAYFLAVDRQEIGFKLPPAQTGYSSVSASIPEAVNSFEFLRRIVGFCRENRIDLRIFITPAHAHQIEIAHAMGEWDRIEKGKRDLVALLARDAGAHGMPSAPLWDFSGDSSVTDEPLPPAQDRREMRYYWDSSHFKEEVGDWVLDRLFATVRPGHEMPGDFGQLLTLANIETVLAKQREAHARYVAVHSDDVQFIRRTVTELRGYGPAAGVYASYSTRDKRASH
jgi:hypothetical protein